MQTIYYSTSHFIRHTGNMVDLDEFRRKQALAQADSLARQPQWDHWEDPSAQTGFQPRVITIQTKKEPHTQPQPRRSRRRLSMNWVLDTCASLGVVAMTLTFMFQVML